VSVVHHHIASERPRRIIINTARSIGHVAHDNTLRAAKPLDNIHNRAPVHHKPFRHLQRDPGRSILFYLGDGFGDLEVVVGGEEVSDGREEKRVRLLCRRELRSDGEGGGGTAGGRRGTGAADKSLSRCWFCWRTGGLWGRHGGWQRGSRLENFRVLSLGFLPPPSHSLEAKSRKALPRLSYPPRANAMAQTVAPLILPLLSPATGLSDLPSELVLAILSHLPHHSSSVRPLSALVPLLSVSRQLAALVTPLLDSQIHLRTLVQAESFLSAQVDDPHRLTRVTTLSLDAPVGPDGQKTRWDEPTLRRLIGCSSHLGALRVRGVESARSLLTILEEAAVSPSLTASQDADSTSSSFQVPLKHLSLDFEGSDSGRSNMDGLARADYPADRELGERCLSQDKGPSPCSMLSVCSGFPSLLELRVSHLDFSPVLPSGAPSQLRQLHLSHSTLSDEVLFAIFSRNAGTLEDVAITECGGFGRTAFIRTIELVGPNLKSLRIATPAQVTSTAPPSSPRRSPPPSPSSVRRMHSSPMRPSLPVPPCASAPNLIDILDTILATTPSLQFLSLSGPVASHYLPRLLPTAIPSLISLSVFHCPSINASSLLPLLTNGPGRLGQLRRMEVDFYSAGDGEGEPEGVEELWGEAVNRGVELAGAAFERVKRRVRWAEELSEELLSTEGVGGEEVVRLKRAGSGRMR
jgi:hypothetical protein